MKKLVSLMMAACSLLSVSVMFASCGHDCEFATEWSKDATNHWHACVGDDEECTEVADKPAHTWNAGTETVDMAAAKAVKTYACTVCGQTKTEERTLSTTVTEEQFTAMFNLGTNWTFTYDVRYDDGSNEHYENTRDGDLYKYYNIDTTAEGEVDYEYIAYAQNDVEDPWYYSIVEVNGKEYFAKESMSEDYEEHVNIEFDTYFIEEFRDFSLYEYDAATQTYKNKAPITVFEGQVTQFYFKAVEGKLVAFGFTFEEDGETMTCTATLTYGNASVTLPENMLPSTMVGEWWFDDMFYFIFIDNWEMTVTATHPAGMTMHQVSTRAGDLYKKVQTETNGSATSTYTLYAEWVNSVMYLYTPSDNSSADQFDKNANERSFDSFIDEEMQTFIPVRDLTLPQNYEYDEETASYVGKEPIAVSDFATILSYTVKVNDNKLVELNYLVEVGGVQIPYVITITYDNASVTLPTNVVEY